MRSLAIAVAALLCASCRGYVAVSSNPAAGTSPPPPMPPPNTAPSPAPPGPSPPPTSSTPSPASAPTGYRIVEIPRLTAAGEVTANAVNGQGIVVGDYEGYCTPDCGGAAQAWMYQQSSGALDELTFDPSESGVSATGISNQGVIVGFEYIQGGAQSGFWTVTGGSMMLTSPTNYGGSFTMASAVNDVGTVAGNVGGSGFGTAPIEWSGPQESVSTLPMLQCDHCPRHATSANAINDAGVVVGSSELVIDAQSKSGTYAVEWIDGNIISLGSLQGGDYSAAYAINNTGDIVGASRVGTSAGAPTHAFLYHDGVMNDLGTLPGDTNSSANSINDEGAVVGASDDGTTNRAFLYQDGKIYDLNSLIAQTDPLAGLVRLQEAVSISANGWIAVNGTDSRDTGASAGSQRAFLLIPSD